MKNIFQYIKGMIVVLVVLFGLLLAWSILPIPGNYSIYTVLSGSMEPTIHVGSIVIAKPQSDYMQNDIITVKSGNPKNPVTHRIVEVLEKDGKKEFVTKGDANESADSVARMEKDVIGRVMFSIPWIGYPIKWAQEPLGFILMIVIPGTIIVYHEVLTIITEIQKKWNLRKNTIQQKEDGGNERKTDNDKDDKDNAKKDRGENKKKKQKSVE